ncbi:MAG TPA: hypothetical protein VH703_06705 [Solirubrobacterales bacterium]
MPVLAQASSAGFEYSSAPPSATGKPPSESNLSGGSSSTSGVGGGESDTNAAGNAKKGGSAAKSSSKGGGSATQAGQGSSGKGGAAPPRRSHTELTGAQPGSDSGSSSPLVPILIAIALLAAGSIAFVMIRKRRAAAGKGVQDAPGQSGSSGPVSPEAS